MPPAPKRKPTDDPTAADPDKNARLETYEQEVERASVESFAEHPEGSAPPLERRTKCPPPSARPRAKAKPPRRSASRSRRASAGGVGFSPRGTFSPAASVAD